VLIKTLEIKKRDRIAVPTVNRAQAREFRRTPQYSHHLSPLIYPLIICELELVDGNGRGNGRGTDNIATPLRWGRDENGIENHQTNLLPLSRVLVTSMPVSSRAHTCSHATHTCTRARNRPPARLTPALFRVVTHERVPVHT